MKTKNGNFVISNYVSNLKESIKKDELTFIDDYNEKVSKQQNFFIPINKDEFRKAFDNICYMYNKDNKARKFVLHLINAFIPIEPLSKILNINDVCKDAITNKNICGIVQLSEAFSKLILDKAKIELAQTDEEKQKAIDILKSKIDVFPDEIKFKRIGYFSDKSDKFLSESSINALLFFVDNAILYDVKEIIFTINKKRFKSSNKEISKRNKLTNSEINQLSKASTYNIKDAISDKTFEKLKNIKNELISK